MHNYAPNFKEVDRAYWFQVVHPSVHSRTAHARVLKFYIWIPHGKIFDTSFFSCPNCPFLELSIIEKIRMKSDACHILWTLYARVLKFHMWIPQGSSWAMFFFLDRVISLSGVMPLWIMKSCQQDITKNILAIFGLETWSADRGWWVDCLIKLKKKSHYFSGVMALWKFWLFKICQQDISKIICARGLKLGKLIGDDE